MKAIRIHNYGSSEELKYEDVPVPEINENQVLVKMYATTVNHLDMKKASGVAKETMPITLPWIPGHDFAGIIENIGTNVTGFQVGDKVYGNCNGGSYAEYLAVNTNTVVMKPENLTFNEAASVPHVGETAWQAIFLHGHLKKGQNILIHGAAGAVGAYAVQFAKLVGATVYATAAGMDKEFLESLGADIIIDYQTEDFTTVAKDIDLALILVGGDTQKKTYSVMREGGRIISTTGPILEQEAKERNVTGISMVIKQSGEDLREISKLIESDKLKTDIAVTYEIKDAIDGWKILSGEDPFLPKLQHGKIVLQVISDNKSI